MGLNFRKSKKIGAVKLTATKKGIGISLGNKLFGISRSATGKKTARISLPGTGLSYTKTLNKKRKK